MRTIREVLRLRLDAGLSERHTARSLGVPRTTVQDYCARFRASGLTWPGAGALDDVALERALFARDPAPLATSRPLPDWALLRAGDIHNRGSRAKPRWVAAETNSKGDAR